MAKIHVRSLTFFYKFTQEHAFKKIWKTYLEWFAFFIALHETNQACFVFQRKVINHLQQAKENKNSFFIVVVVVVVCSFVPSFVSNIFMQNIYYFVTGTDTNKSCTLYALLLFYIYIFMCTILSLTVYINAYVFCIVLRKFT